MFRKLLGACVGLAMMGMAGTANSTLLLSATEAGPIFTGLGDLPGGIIASRAFAISGDGLVVVGDSPSAGGERLLDGARPVG